MSSANCSEFFIFYVNGMQIPQIRFFTPNFIFTLCIFCIKTFFKKKFFCEHFLDTLCYYNTRKPPNTLYSFLLHPIRNKKYLLRKRTVERIQSAFPLPGYLDMVMSGKNAVFACVIEYLMLELLNMKWQC